MTSKGIHGGLRVVVWGALLGLVASACGDRAPGPGVGDGAITGDASVLDAGSGVDAGPGADAGPGVDAGPTRPAFLVCDQAPDPTGLPTVDWNHTLSGITASAGDPGHSAQDVITVVGTPTALVGKFAYGLISKDLEDEWVEVYLDTCQGTMTRLGETLTDSDGRIAFDLATADLPPVGRYRVWLRVKGDNSHTSSTLRVVLPDTHLMVMDIDATLTTDDMELFQDVFADLFGPLGTGDYVPVPRAGAVDLTLRRGPPDQGYLLVYMTGRPYWLTDITRQWIADQGLSPGHLHVTDSNGEALPTESGVGTYKRDYLLFLLGLGLQIDAAYGNATTDIWAYEQAGVDKASTFIVGDHGGESGTVDVGDDYTAHLQDIAGEPDVVQPFDW